MCLTWLAQWVTLSVKIRSHLTTWRLWNQRSSNAMTSAMWVKSIIISFDICTYDLCEIFCGLNAIVAKRPCKCMVDIWMINSTELYLQLNLSLPAFLAPYCYSPLISRHPGSVEHQRHMGGLHYKLLHQTLSWLWPFKILVCILVCLHSCCSLLSLTCNDQTTTS